MRWVVLVMAWGACGGTAAEGNRAKEPLAIDSTSAASVPLLERWPRPEVYAQRVANARCGDLLRMRGINIADFEYVGCEASMLSQLSTLRAQYRVSGARAEAARASLQARIGVPKEMRFECCGFTTGASEH